MSGSPKSETSSALSMSVSNSYNTPWLGNQPTKRKRVTRACDCCRHKKVKCDGKQPCIHCTVYSYNCTYDQPNVRNKKAPPPVPSDPQLNPILKLLSLNRANYVPNSSVPNLQLCQSLLQLLFPKLQLNLMDDLRAPFDLPKLQRIVGYLQQKNPSVINVREISDMYLEGTTPNASPINQLDPYVSTTALNEDSLGAEIKIILPPKEVALQLIFTTWTKACVLFRFYHRPSLLEEVDLLYSMDPAYYTNRQQRFLPFMYSILACGSLFSRLPYTNSLSDHSSDNSLEDDGFKYFLEARKLIDITNVGDIPSIQTIVMMIIYLQCSARLSTCYSYIGIALRSALKEGLHRNLSIFQSSRRKLDPIEVDTRKRLFYTIYKMDIYINSLLGLSQSISEDEYDQSFPVELDDEFITRDSYLFDKQQGRLSSSGCANHHTKLTIILSHIVKALYPIKIKAKLTERVVSDKMHDKVTELEFELKQWLDNLPPELKPTDPNDPESSKKIPDRFLLANYYLHFAFLNCQNNLYRPFIHYISNGYQASNSDPRSLIRGRNCIKVARMVVKLANKMINQNLLIGTYWFSMYTIFFSIACLIYYFHFANYNNQHENNQGMNYAGVLFDDDLNIEMIKEDIEIGRKVLDTLKNMSNASLRIYNILNNLFEQLNRRTADTSMKTSFKSGTSLEANDENVQLTLRNFDDINDFRAGRTSQVPVLDTFGLIELTRDAAQDGYTELFDRSAERAKNSEGRKSFNAVDETDAFTSDTWKANPQLQYAESIGASSDNVENNYVPGVMDTIDTQIFGRILPPYMLEGNMKQAHNAKADADMKTEVKPEDMMHNLGLEEGEGGVDEGMPFDNFDALDPFNLNY